MMKRIDFAAGWTDFGDIYRDIYKRNAWQIDYYKAQTAEWIALHSLGDDLMWAINRVERAVEALEEVLGIECAWNDTLMPLAPIKDVLQSRAEELNAQYRANEEMLEKNKRKKGDIS